MKTFRNMSDPFRQFIHMSNNQWMKKTENGCKNRAQNTASSSDFKPKKNLQTKTTQEIELKIQENEICMKSMKSENIHENHSDQT